MTDLEAVIWDFGGVITTSPFAAFDAFEREHGLPPGFLRATNAANPDTNAWARFERAEIDAATFDRLFAIETAERGHRVAGCAMLALLAGDVRPAVVQALRVCRTRFKAGCITNTVPSAGAAGIGPGMSRSPKAAREVAEVFGLFDHVIESARTGLRKPDPRIYALMCEALDVEPSRCVFLDDLGINLKPARAMGMTTIKVETEAQLLADLAAITGLSWG